MGRGHCWSPLGSDPGARVSKVSFKGRAALMWLLLCLLKAGKQASVPSCPRKAAQIPGLTPCPRDPPSRPNTVGLISLHPQDFCLIRAVMKELTRVGPALPLLCPRPPWGFW